MGNEIFGNSHQAGGSTCRIKTGTYTGDGTTGQAITGVGFQLKYVYIFPAITSQTAQNSMFKTDQFGIYAIWETPSSFYSYDNRIVSLDSDGFTVDDDGLNSFPNASGVTYNYLALG